MSQKEALEIVRQYVKLLNKSGLSIYKAFIYGSYATNQASAESDIDVLLVSKVFDEPGIAAKAQIWALTRQVDTRIEPYGVGMRKFLSDDVSPLLSIVKREGIEILELQS
jgi:predicted nucleotidyltransferase